MNKSVLLTNEDFAFREWIKDEVDEVEVIVSVIVVVVTVPHLDSVEG